jgi:hypothetical protein
MQWTRYFILFAMACVLPLSVSAHTGPYISSPSNTATFGPAQVPPPPLPHRATPLIKRGGRTITVQTEMTSPPVSFQRTLLPSATSNLFSRNWGIDVTAATDGTYILNLSNSVPGLEIYSMDGSQVYISEGEGNFFCNSSPLPICQSPGFPGDMRTYYDTVSKRWIMAGIWVFGPTGLVIAVSATSDPRGPWYKYQSPPCGPSDPETGDQPHLGFNRYWIVINTLCSSNGYSLQVFDKAALYNGQPLCGPNTCGTGQVNWWEFRDQGFGVANDGREDDPVATYDGDASNEYLVHTGPVQVQPGGPQSAEFDFSRLSGSEFAPQLVSDVFSIRLEGVAVDGAVANGDTPTCTGCMHTFNWPKVESAQLRKLVGGDKWLLASAASYDYPASPNTNYAAFVGYNLNTKEVAASMIGAPGMSIMSAEINAIVHNRSDAVNIVWTSTAGNFYPGFQGYAWSVHNGTISNGFSYEGSETPDASTPEGSFERSRWLDFTDAAKPIPDGTSSLIAAPIAVPSGLDNQQGSLWFTN